MQPLSDAIVDSPRNKPTLHHLDMHEVHHCKIVPVLQTFAYEEDTEDLWEATSFARRCSNWVVLSLRVGTSVSWFKSKSDTFLKEGVYSFSTNSAEIFPMASRTCWYGLSNMVTNFSMDSWILGPNFQEAREKTACIHATFFVCEKNASDSGLNSFSRIALTTGTIRRGSWRPYRQ